MKAFINRPMVKEIVGYCLLVLVLFGRAIVPPSDWMLFGDDIHRAYYFFREFLNEWLRQGVFPLWNPYLFGGTPFLADPIVNVWYPANWLFFLVPLPLAYSWHVAFHLIWAGTGMCLLLNRHVNNRVASWAGGTTFMLSGFFMARTWNGHVDVIAAASFMPWVVDAFLRLMGEQERRHIARRIGIAATVFFFQLLSGYQTMAFMTVIVVGVSGIVSAIREKTVRPIIRAGIAGVLGIGVAAFHLVPVQEFFRMSIRTYSLPYSWVSYGAWEIRSLIQFFNPFFFGDQRMYEGPPPNFGEHSAFIGITGLIFIGIALYALFFRRAKQPLRHLLVSFGIVCVITAILGIWLSLGPNAGIDLQYIAWKLLPMYHYLRIPTRHLILVVFGLSALVGIGISRFMDRSRLPRWVWGCVVGVMVFEMLFFGKHFIELQKTPETRHEKPLIELLTGDTAPYRVLQNFGVWLDARDALDFDGVMSYGISSATGYSPGILRPYYEYIARSVGQRGEQAMLSHDVQVPYLSPDQAETIDFLNIKYLIVPPDHDPFANNSRYRLIWDDDARKYRLYENTTVYPRFFLSDRSCGTAEVSRYTPNVITLTVETSCDATLISSEVWYPGWSATVNGEKTRIDKTNEAFRTVFVPRGKHTVTYRYIPTALLLGLFVSGTFVGLYWYGRKKRFFERC